MTDFGSPLTEVPEPWDDPPLDAEGLRAFKVVAARLVRDRVIIELDRLLLTSLAWYWSQYRQLREEQRQHPRSRKIPEELAAVHHSARRLAADYFLLPAARVNFAKLDSEGEDVELAEIFGLEAQS